MPTPITKYLCDICKTEHYDELRAQSCENLGYPPDTSHIKIGDTMTFTRDVTKEITGEIKTYVKGEGIVLNKEVKFNSMTNQHHDLFLVQTENELGAYEGFVAMVNIQGKMEPFMAASPRYQVGFNESMKKAKTNGQGS